MNDKIFDIDIDINNNINIDIDIDIFVNVNVNVNVWDNARNVIGRFHSIDFIAKVIGSHILRGALSHSLIRINC
jgi:hypothetical protein